MRRGDRLRGFAFERQGEAVWGKANDAAGNALADKDQGRIRVFNEVGGNRLGLKEIVLCSPSDVLPLPVCERDADSFLTLPRGATLEFVLERGPKLLDEEERAGRRRLATATGMESDRCLGHRTSSMADRMDNPDARPALILSASGHLWGGWAVAPVGWWGSARLGGERTRGVLRFRVNWFGFLDYQVRHLSNSRASHDETVLQRFSSEWKAVLACPEKAQTRNAGRSVQPVHQSHPRQPPRRQPAMIACMLAGARRPTRIRQLPGAYDADPPRAGQEGWPERPDTTGVSWSHYQANREERSRGPTAYSSR